MVRHLPCNVRSQTRVMIMTPLDQIAGRASHIYVSRVVIPGDDREIVMAKRKVQTTDEPMGIVISRGAQQDPAPTVLAFVWGPADAELPELAAA